MTIVTNNNINNFSLMLNLSQSGVNGADGTALTGNFLDMISVLSDSSDLNLKNIDDAELLLGSPENDEVSTLQLLQKLFEENGVKPKTNIKSEVTEKFFELVNKTKNGTDNPKLDIIEMVPCALSNPERLPAEKILINNAFAELKDDDLSNKLSSESEIMSIDKSFETKLPEGSEVNSGKFVKLRNIPTWPAIIDTSVLVDPNPDTVVIDIGNVIDEISNEFDEFDEFQISKFFTRLPIETDQNEEINTGQNEEINTGQNEEINTGQNEEINTGQNEKNYTGRNETLKENDNIPRKEDYFDGNGRLGESIVSDINLQDVIPKLKETNLDLKINLGINSVTVRGVSENFSVIEDELPISDDLITQNKVIAVEIDKVEGQNLLINLGSNRFSDPSKLPRKVFLQFSEAKPIGSKPSIKVMSVDELKLKGNNKLIDTNHAAVMVKSNENIFEQSAEPDLILKVFDPELLQLNYDKASWPINGVEPAKRDFSQELSSSLQTFVSGEFSIKAIFNTLQETVGRNSVTEVLAEIIKPQVSELINVEQFKTKTKLLISTADVLIYRETLESFNKQFSSTYFPINLDGVGKMVVQPFAEVELASNSGKTLDQKVNEGESKVNFLEQAKQTNNTQSSTSTTSIRAQASGISTFINTVNLYEANFTSRVGMLLAEQMTKGRENFEIQLEPESFGKVRVNVSLESSNIEVKMIADNTAAVMALRGGENMLQVLAEQNGLKLSDYSVDLQSNQNGQSSGQDKNFQKEQDELKNIENIEQEIEIENADSMHNLNLLA